jgi:hypothetical protein
VRNDQHFFILTPLTFDRLPVERFSFSAFLSCRDFFEYKFVDDICENVGGLFQRELRYKP